MITTRQIAFALGLVVGAVVTGVAFTLAIYGGWQPFSATSDEAAQTRPASHTQIAPNLKDQILRVPFARGTGMAEVIGFQSSAAKSDNNLHVGDKIAQVEGVPMLSLIDTVAALSSVFQSEADEATVTVYRDAPNGGGEIQRTIDIPADDLETLTLAVGRNHIRATALAANCDVTTSAFGDRVTAWINNQSGTTFISRALECWLTTGGLKHINDLVDGETLLSKLVRAGRPKIVRLLLEHKADVNAPNTDGRTPLIVAASTGNNEIAAALLAAGASVALRDASGQNAIQVAKKNGFSDTAKLLQGLNPTVFLSTDQKRKLIEQLMSIDLINNSGHTPGDAEIADAIKEYQNWADLPVTGLITPDGLTELTRFTRQFLHSAAAKASGETTAKTLSRVFARELSASWGIRLPGRDVDSACKGNVIGFSISPDQRVITWKEYDSRAEYTRPIQSAAFKVMWAGERNGYIEIMVKPDPAPISGGRYQLWSIRDGVFQIQARTSVASQGGAASSYLVACPSSAEQ